MNKSNGNVGIGIADVLTIVFVVLKLVGVINWSWWWVLSPVWGSIVLVLILWIVILICERKDW